MKQFWVPDLQTLHASFLYYTLISLFYHLAYNSMFTPASVSFSMKEGFSLQRLFIVHYVIANSVFIFVCLLSIPEEMYEERESQTQDNLIKSVVILYQLSN